MTPEEKLERIKDAITLNKKLHLQYNGRPDCKNCSLMEVIEGILAEQGSIGREATNKNQPNMNIS